MQAKDFINLCGGSKVLVRSGDQKGVWLKLDIKSNINFLSSWVNVETGRVLHFSWLLNDSEVLVRKFPEYGE